LVPGVGSENAQATHLLEKPSFGQHPAPHHPVELVMCRAPPKGLSDQMASEMAKKVTNRREVNVKHFPPGGSGKTPVSLTLPKNSVTDPIFPPPQAACSTRTPTPPVARQRSGSAHTLQSSRSCHVHSTLLSTRHRPGVASITIRMCAKWRAHVLLASHAHTLSHMKGSHRINPCKAGAAAPPPPPHPPPTPPPKPCPHCTDFCNTCLSDMHGGMAQPAVLERTRPTQG
jgi:hypothetical protein